VQTKEHTVEQTIAVAIVKPLCVTIDVAAQMAQVSRVTVYGWIKQGKLKTVPVGSDQRVLVEEFEAFLRSGRGAGPTNAGRAAALARTVAARPKLAKK
jgi:excisionase family DNA binding protein